MKTDRLLFFYKGWVNITDHTELKVKFEKHLNISGFQILNFVEHHFSPYGYTCLWLLGESHLAIHTFPEFSKTYFELCSCSETKLNHFKRSYKGYSTQL